MAFSSAGSEGGGGEGGGEGGREEMSGRKGKEERRGRAAGGERDLGGECWTGVVTTGAATAVTVGGSTTAGFTPVSGAGAGGATPVSWLRVVGRAGASVTSSSSGALKSCKEESKGRRVRCGGRRRSATATAGEGPHTPRTPSGAGEEVGTDFRDCDTNGAGGGPGCGRRWLHALLLHALLLEKELSLQPLLCFGLLGGGLGLGLGLASLLLALLEEEGGDEDDSRVGRGDEEGRRGRRGVGKAEDGRRKIRWRRWRKMRWVRRRRHHAVRGQRWVRRWSRRVVHFDDDVRENRTSMMCGGGTWMWWEGGVEVVEATSGDSRAQVEDGSSVPDSPLFSVRASVETADHRPLTDRPVSPAHTSTPLPPYRHTIPGSHTAAAVSLTSFISLLFPLPLLSLFHTMTSSLDFERAAAYFQQSDAQGQSLYTHLSTILLHLSNPTLSPTPTPSLIPLSLSLKASHLPQLHLPELPSHPTPTAPPLLAHLKTESTLLLPTLSSLPTLSPLPLPSLLSHSDLLSQAGVALPRDRLLHLEAAALSLARAHSLTNIRFWGLIHTTSSTYHIFESALTPPPSPDTAEAGTAGAGEAAGKGANAFLYYVGTAATGPFTVLPPASPECIAASAALHRLFTGDLTAAVPGHPTFPGVEADLLRAVIARISHGAMVGPKGGFSLEDETEAVTPTPDWEGAGADELAEVGAWVHLRPKLLKSGRTVPQVKPDGEEGEGEEAEAEVEEPVPALGPLDGDETGAEAYPAWVVRQSAKGHPHAVTWVRSGVWPGAVAVQKRGNGVWVYVGWGLRYRGGGVGGWKRAAMGGMGAEWRVAEGEEEEGGGMKEQTDEVEKLEEEKEEEKEADDNDDDAEDNDADEDA